MATVKPVLRYYKNEEGKKAVYIRLSHKGKNRYVSFGVHIPPSVWNDGRVSKSYSGWAKINQIIDNEVNKYQNKIYELEQSRKNYSVDDILKVDESKPSLNFIKYARKYIEKFRKKGSINSYRRHKTIINKLDDYTGGTLNFEDITVSFLSDYEDHLAEIGNNVNTRHGNLKVIRAILYQAIREGIFPQEKNPFFNFKLKKKKTYKEKLTEPELDAIRELNLKVGSFIWHTRNYFLASFNLYGMRFADLCRLKGVNIHQNNGSHRISYEMGKTGRKLSIKVGKELRELILKYHNNLRIGNNEYIFPLLKGTYEDVAKETQAISSRNAQVNNNLKKIAKRAEINKSLSFHIARHTFADIARRKNDIYEVSKMLGHSSVRQTETYVASLDTDGMDRAADKVYERDV